MKIENAGEWNGWRVEQQDKKKVRKVGVLAAYTQPGYLYLI